MMLHPVVLALFVGSLVTAAMLAAAAFLGLRIRRHWDLASGSEAQLRLERQTYLVSTVMSYVLAFQVLSLFLFIHTADSLSRLFIGAMCAAGSLKVNAFGYPTLVVKIGNCLLAGLWLILNAIDNRAPDYPLIRTKYLLLLVMTPVLLAEVALQSLYLLKLEPNVITSCCAIVFSPAGGPVAAGFLALPCWLSQGAFVASAAVSLLLGWSVYRRGRGGTLFALASLGHFLLAVNALIAFISLYIYELPTHHCPFCLLHREYGFIGYPLYAALLVDVIAGTGAGLIGRYRAVPTLRVAVPIGQRRLALTALLAKAAFLLIAGGAVFFSNLSMTA